MLAIRLPHLFKIISIHHAGGVTLAIRLPHLFKAGGDLAHHEMGALVMRYMRERSWMSRAK
jgi:hypothetical protein